MSNFIRVSAPAASTIIAISCFPAMNWAASTTDASAVPTPSSQAVIDEVVVTARRLNEARAGIETKTGASTYKLPCSACSAASF